MRSYIAIPVVLIIALVTSLPGSAADDWTFIAGKYALDPDDCKLVATATPFSKELVDGLSQEVLTKEGVTSPREVHCKFRTSEKTGSGWKVQADCEELGVSEPAEIAVTTASDGSVSLLSEDIWGPDAQKFALCK